MHKLSRRLLCLLLAGCSTANVTSESSPPANSRPRCQKLRQQSQPERRLLKRRFSPVRSKRSAQRRFTPKVAGYVDQLKVDIGDRVKGPVRDSEGKLLEPGQLLAVLSAPELEEEFHQKEAMVEQVEAEVLQSESAIKVAMSMQESANAGVEETVAGQQRADAQFARWKSEYDRMQALAEAKTITPKLAEETELQFKSAQASQSEANAKLKSAKAAENEAAVAVEKAQADLQATKSHLKVAEADRDRVAALREYLQIRAPFDGIITERSIDAGHLVQAARSSADQPLFVLIQADTVRLFIDVPEAEASLVETGRPAKITVSAMGNAAFDGIVARTGWALQTGTRSLKCEIDVPNPDGKLRPGMYAQVELTVAERADALSRSEVSRGCKRWPVILRVSHH
jgi:HlyD family secretion protein